MNDLPEQNPAEKNPAETAPIQKKLTEAERTLAQTWGQCHAFLGGWIVSEFEALLRALKFGAMDRIFVTASRDARLNGYDEKIYESYACLTRLYEKAAEYYEHNRAFLRTISISKITNRIYSALYEQIQQYQNNLENQDENPMTAEKIKIIGGNMAFFTMRFQELKNEYRQSALTEDCDAVKRELLAWENTFPTFFPPFAEAIENRLLAYFLEKSYEAYSQAVQSCLYTLNNLHNRADMERYYHLLESQQDLLGADVQTQVAAIEQELLRSVANTQEEGVTRQFLTFLRECCQFYTSNVSEILRAFQETHNQNEAAAVESLEDFQQVFRDIFVNSRIALEKTFLEKILIYADRASETLAQIKCHIDVLWQNIFAGSKEAAEQLWAQVQQEKKLAEELASLFASLTSFYRERDFLYEAFSENEILRGINETLFIKIESLEENKSMFAQKADEILRSFPEESPPPDPEQAAPILFRIWKKIFWQIPAETSLGDDEKRAGLFADFYRSAAADHALREYKRKKDEAFERQIEKIQRLSLNFKKNAVLYEISTYEEILQYSVSRLRESDREAVLDYVQLIDESVEKIARVLEKNNISIISPEPREPFNGREHEALMAEKNEAFEKGQIIKRVTSGYRQGDKVLLRANVIAAR
ncbi:MAG: nucleotide exchange factor GrpE [Clostridiales bacterium]|jgi:molecular chaperone GrpE (heat shock protein)|nr:nucleotide exchange factor GrpE [Clostridiales bacterium]